METVVKNITDKSKNQDVENMARDVMSKMLKDRDDQMKTQAQEIERLRETVKSIVKIQNMAGDDQSQKPLSDIEQVKQDVKGNAFSANPVSFVGSNHVRPIDQSIDHSDRFQSKLRDKSVPGLGDTATTAFHEIPCQTLADDTVKVNNIRRAARNAVSDLPFNQQVKHPSGTIESPARKKLMDDLEEVAKDKNRDYQPKPQDQGIEIIRNAVETVVKDAMPDQSSEKAGKVAGEVVSEVLSMRGNRNQTNETKLSKKQETTKAAEELSHLLNMYRETNAKKDIKITKSPKTRSPSKESTKSRYFFGFGSSRSSRRQQQQQQQQQQNQHKHTKGKKATLAKASNSIVAKTNTINSRIIKTAPIVRKGKRDEMIFAVVGKNSPDVELCLSVQTKQDPGKTQLKNSRRKKKT